MSSTTIKPPPSERQWFTKRLAGVMGLLLWTGLSMMAGMLMYKAEWHVKAMHLLDGRSPQVESLPRHDTILKFDRDLLETLQPEHRFQARNRAEWQTWQIDLTTRLRQLLQLDQLPTNFVPAAQVVEQIEWQGVRREKILLTTEPGLQIPLYLLMPLELTAPTPAVIVFHGHGLGKRETSGEVPSYQNRAALEIAKAGFIAVAPDQRGFGELGWVGQSYDVIHHNDIIVNLMMGRTTLGTFVHDARKLVDYLLTRSEVDGARIGAVGCSLGGVLAVWSAALDPRIQAVVSSASFGSMRRDGLAQRLLQVPEEISRDYRRLPAYTEFHVPSLFRYADASDIASLIAPRPLLFDIDRNDKPKSADYMSTVGRVYELVGAPEHLDIFLHDNGHTFSIEPTIAWLHRWLRPSAPGSP